MKNIKTSENTQSSHLKGNVPSKIKAMGSPRNNGDLTKSPTMASNKLTNWKSQKALKINDQVLSSPDQLTKSAISPNNACTINSPETETQHSTLKQKAGVKGDTVRAMNKQTSPRNNFAAKPNERKVQKQKTAGNQNSCKGCEQMKKKHQQLMEKIEQIEKKHQQQINMRESSLLELGKQKTEIMKKLQKFDTLKAQNKKLIKQKTNKFKQAGDELKLKAQITELQQKIQQLEKQRSSSEIKLQQQTLQLQSNVSPSCDSNEKEHQQNGNKQLNSQEQVFESMLQSKHFEMNNCQPNNPCLGQINMQKKNSQNVHVISDEANKQLLEKLQKMEQELKNREQMILRLKDERLMIRKQNQLSEKEISSFKEEISMLRKQNEELRNKVSDIENSKNERQLKQSSILLNGMTSSSLAEFKKSRINYQSKIDRIKAISEHQFQIIQQMKESSKIALSQLKQTSSILR